MASHYILICIVFVSSTIYQTLAFLDASHHLLSPHRRIAYIRQSLSTDDDCHQLGDDQSDDDQGKKVRFRSRVSYCGTPFCGWQLQPHRTTVQGEIEEALFRRYNRRIAVVGAGRTDAGVHARGQAIHFDLFQDEVPFPSVMPNATDSERNNVSADFCNELQYSMNRMMRLDIRLFRLQLAPYLMTTKGQTSQDDSNEEEQQYLSVLPRLRLWHAIQSSTSKWYSYRFTLGPTLFDPMERFTRTHFVHRPSFAPSTGPTGQPYAITTQDISRLKSILGLYVGTHDFKAFGGQLEQNEKRAGRKINTIRTIHKVELVNESLEESHLCFIGEEGNYRIDFLIEGALYKMIRNMVGTAIQVWLGNMEQAQLIELLQVDQCDIKSRKSNPCKPAPPEGLTLECVYYEDLF
eukprot:scaffold16849_cov145-Skeletonema_menzelii.AAC.9